jgi:hypothetical protein
LKVINCTIDVHETALHPLIAGKKKLASSIT